MATTKTAIESVMGRTKKETYQWERVQTKVSKAEDMDIEAED
jgi:hypothetical protein